MTVGDALYDAIYEKAVEVTDILIAALTKALVPAVQMVKDIMDALKPIYSEYLLQAEYEKVYPTAPNSRVKHLSRYGKTRRIRKKNMKRLIKENKDDF